MEIDHVNRKADFYSEPLRVESKLQGCYGRIGGSFLQFLAFSIILITFC